MIYTRFAQSLNTAQRSIAYKSDCAVRSNTDRWNKLNKNCCLRLNTDRRYRHSGLDGMWLELACFRVAQSCSEGTVALGAAVAGGNAS